MIVCGMSKKLFLRAVWMKRKIRTIKGLFDQFYGQLKGPFGLFFARLRGSLGCFVCILYATLFLEG